MRSTAYSSIWLHLCELKLCLKSGLCSKAVSKALLISAHFWETFWACKIVIKLTPGYRNKLPWCQCTVKWQLRLVPSQVQSWSDSVRILAVISGGSGTRVKRSCPTELPRMNSWAKGQQHFCEMPDLGLCLGLSVTSKERASRYLTMITASSVAWVSMLRENPDFKDGVSDEVAWTLKN